jgi:hypothetical protein
MTRGLRVLMTPTVQWQVSVDGGQTFKNIPGATSSTLAVTAQTGKDLFQYRAAFTNRYGVAYTSAATLTVTSVSLTSPVVTKQPKSPPVALNPGQRVTFTAAASHADAVQWQVSSDGMTYADIPHAISASYTVVARAGQNGFLFRALFTNPMGTTASGAAVLPVNPAIKRQPTNQTVYAGQTATFTAAAVGNPFLSVQWQVSSDGRHFGDIPNATATTLTVTTPTNGLRYRAIFSDTDGPVPTQTMTRTVIVTVQQLPLQPVVVKQPTKQTTEAGRSVRFTAMAVAAGPLSVQWYVLVKGTLKFVPIQNNPTAMSNTLVFTASAADKGNKYRAMFRLGNASITSTSATLTLMVPPLIVLQPHDQAAAPGQLVAFTAGTSGAPATVQWQVSSDGGATYVAIPGARGLSLMFTAQPQENGNLYRAVFTNAVGQAITKAAVLVIT